MNSFQKAEGSGLLTDYYAEEDALTDALRKKRQKLAETKLGLEPDAEDSDNG